MDHHLLDRISVLLARRTNRRAGILAALGLIATPAIGSARKKKRTCTVCASGCRHTTIEAAVAEAASGAVITVGPGTYTPLALDPTSIGVISITQDLTIRACSTNHHQIPVIQVDPNTTGSILFTIGNVDAQYTCIGEQPKVLLENLIIENTTENTKSAIAAACNGKTTLRNLLVSGFGSSTQFAPIGFGLGVTGLVDRCLIRGNGVTYVETITGIAAFSTDPLAHTELTIKDSEITDNHGPRGALSVSGNTTMKLTGSTKIHGNTATGYGGGGVYLSVGSANLTPELKIGREVLITGNPSAVQGGGIFASADTTVTGATNRTVRGNTGDTCNNYWQATACVLN